MLKTPLWKVLLAVFVALASITFSLPSLITNNNQAEEISSFLPDRKINLGLDLRGGSQLLLELDMATYLKQIMEDEVDSIKAELRKEGLSYRDFSSNHESITFTQPDKEFIQKTRSIARAGGEFLVEEKEGVFTLSLDEQNLRTRKSEIISQSIEIVRRRVDETGTTEPIIQRQGDNRILVQVPGLSDPERLKNLIGQTAKITFHLVGLEGVYASPNRPSVANPGSMIVESLDKGKNGEKLFYTVKRRALLGGDSLVNAQATFETGRPVVAFSMDSVGTRRFAEITRENVGKPFAILLDNKIISAPVINEPITGGSGIISGNFTVESANDLALLLRAGALPAPLKVIEERTVGPSLGADSIEAGKIACLVALFAVMTFMILYYSLFGLFSCIALTLNLFVILSVLALLQATLTLPGIAGIVLTLGMAVDANVLIYERIKEEARSGRTMLSAIESGFDRAYGTILDSNLTTMLAGLVLFIMGSGTVKGFAVTLIIGIVASMFTAVVVNKILIVAWLRRLRPSSLPI